MFEKDIYQLIRGLRAHKGNEREYIQLCLRECRKEIKGADMDQKATALLKLVYLEMFGHDMSWASFNVLEVMSSQKYLQKRVGYLAAVQSFRPDTEVLMLAENLLKKDLNSPDKNLIQLPLIAIPHVVNPSMANSLLTDLLPRLSHSSPAIRKKTIVTLYRLALVYPETLRPAWPKIKERLSDEDEDPSVTAAIVNVVCELGWRRPQDFLPLAPRLFELLTASGNNWMAIKIIKLFSVLTPLEPRLVKKLLPPLTSIIKTTPAMSLLYECINGIIQGGIMEAAGGTTEGDEVARLCLSKLRAMLVVEGDPNLRYVALLAFAKITSSHADLVAQHQDVILECIDDPDISIRTRALDLVVGMIHANNLQIVVERLLKQLKSAGVAPIAADPTQDRGTQEGIVPMADDDDDVEANVRPKESKSSQAPPLPEDYRAAVIQRILEMCLKDTYANMNDFDWYIGILVDLVKQCPHSTISGSFGAQNYSIADSIGAELLNVAVRVQAVRPEAAAAAQSLLLVEQREQLFPAAGSGGHGVLAAAAFIAGEYASLLPDPEAVLTSLIDSSSSQLPATTLINYLQAVPKVFAILTSDQHSSWTTQRQSRTVLLTARVVHFLEPLTLHPYLDVQERAVEYLDLMRLASEAASNQTTAEDGGYSEPPLLLTQAIPSLFNAAQLNPVSAAAVRKVPLPEGLDLDTPINASLQLILHDADFDDAEFDVTNEDAYRYYHMKPSAVSIDPRAQSQTASEALDAASSRPSSNADAESLLNHQRRQAERHERYRDDPYYIGSSARNSSTSTPVRSIRRSANNGEELDVDSIPVMELQLDTASDPDQPITTRKKHSSTAEKKPRRHFEIAADETLGGGDDDHRPPVPALPNGLARGKKSLLQLDSSALSTLSLNDTGGGSGGSGTRMTPLEIERRQGEEAEMARALREVERLRLEMQRREESIGGDQDEGVVVATRRKKKKVRTVEAAGAEQRPGNGGEDGDGVGVEKKKKEKKKVNQVDERGEVGGWEGEGGDDVQPAVIKKKKKQKKEKRQVTFDPPT